MNILSLRLYLSLFLIYCLSSYGYENTSQPHSLFNTSYQQFTIKQLEHEIKSDPNNIDLLLQLGGCYYQQNEYKNAISCFQKVQTIIPDSPNIDKIIVDCYFNLGVEEFQQNQLEAAAEAFKNILHIQPDHLEATNNLALIRFEQKRNGEALQIIETGLEYHPNHTPLLKLKARELTEQKDFKSLLPVMERLHINEPKNMDTALNLAILYRYFHKTRKVDSLYTQLIDQNPQDKQVYDVALDYYENLFQYQKLRTIYEKMESHFADDTTAGLKIAETYEHEGLWSEARHKYESIQKSSRKTDLDLRIAWTYLKENNHEKAIEHYLAILDLTPSHYETHAHLAGVYTSLGQFNDAIQTYGKMTQINNQNPAGHIGLGQVYEKMWKQEQAVQAYQQAIRIGTDDPRPYFRLYTVYQKRNDFKQQTYYRNQTIRKAVHQLKEIQENLLKEFDNKLNILQMQNLSQNREAMQAPEKMLRTCLNDLTQIHSDKSAITEIRLLAEEYPKNSMILEHLAVCYEKNQQKHDALLIYKRIIQNNPNSKTAHLGMAQILELTDQNKAAISAYQRAQQLDLYDKTIYQALIRLHQNTGKLDSLVTLWQQTSAFHSENMVLKEYLNVAIEKLENGY